jgi:ABC-2 type transport system permease protein
MQWVGLITLIRRECAVISRYWFATLAPPAMAAALYFTIFGGVLGGHIGRVHGVPYAEYMAPGLIVLTAMPYAFTHTASGLLGARIFKFVEEMLVAPMPRWIIAVGYIVGGVLRGLTVGLVSTTIGLLFLDLHLSSPWMVVLALFLVTLSAAAAGLIAALLVRSFHQIAAIEAFVLTPLAILGGVFTPVSVLPAWAQVASPWNPIFYMVNAIRSAFIGASEVAVGDAVIVLTVMSIAMIAIASLLISRRVLSFERDASSL